ncbi:hypothetical protein JYB64_18350 [Algoriphagus aestuarii]|nr:hypothetical protein [Algoriphagus aestuarii]
MRQLSEQELDQVKKAISAKELTSAEILLEIYDHYVSHLEGFESSRFEEQINLLDEKWTIAYCKKLEYDLQKSTGKSIRNTQWKIIKSYFSWPRFLFNATILALLTFTVNSFSFKNQILLLFGLPLIYIAGFALYVNFRNKEKLAIIKKILGDKINNVTSIANSKLTVSIVLPLHFYNLFLNVPRMLGWTEGIPDLYLNLFSIIFCYAVILHSLSIYETWKVKFKTELL